MLTEDMLDEKMKSLEEHLSVMIDKHKLLVRVIAGNEWVNLKNTKPLLSNNEMYAFIQLAANQMEGEIEVMTIENETYIRKKN